MERNPRTRWRFRFTGPDGGVHSLVIEGDLDQRDEATFAAYATTRKQHGVEWVAAAEVTIEELGPDPYGISPRP